MKIVIWLFCFVIPAGLMAQEFTMIDTWNKATVQDWPSKFPSFTLTKSAKVTYINTYHWNGGKGSNPGFIKIYNDVENYGPWQANSREGLNNVMWEVRPGVVLPAGIYRVIDSDVATWSHNSESGGVGFCSVVVEYNLSGDSEQSRDSGGPGGRDNIVSTLDISGKYDIGGGAWVRFEQNGSAVSGEWSNGSKIVDAHMEGNHLIGKYQYPGASVKGSIDYVFYGDESCFEGKWSDNGHSGIEKGCKAFDITGKYKIEGNAWVKFVQQGSSVTGEWNNGSKIVNASINNRRLVGKYQYPGASVQGSIDFLFNEDASCYEGKWLDNGISGTEKGCK